MEKLIVILLPILLALPIRKIKKQWIHLYAIMLSTVTSLLVFCLLFNSGETYDFLSFSSELTLSLCFDGLGKYFASIVSFLYPLTAIYAWEYMEDDSDPASFYLFFLIAYGITLGVGMSANFFTLYCFYELLTLSTMPLVLHLKDERSYEAAKTYILISIGGASLVFLCLVYILSHPDPTPGGLTQLFYILGFFGFGVKAAVFPLHSWLPKASCAVTPVTALLHAVAVVKSGVFAIIRLTYYIFPITAVKGTLGQTIPLIFVIFTIFYGSSMAVKETHFKRRMAYSTVANLSYILFGILLMSQDGFIAGLLHMSFHAFIKILAFFAVGSIMHHTGKEYLYELDGLGKVMPFTFLFYTIAALSLTGIPPFAGFVSKAYLLLAGIGDHSVLGFTGSLILIVSALLTAINSFSPFIRAFFSNKTTQADHKEAGLRMLIPMGILAVLVLICGLKGDLFLSWIKDIYLSLEVWS